MNKKENNALKDHQMTNFARETEDLPLLILSPQIRTYSQCFKTFSVKLKKANTSKKIKKYIYINIWAINCSPCTEELSFLNTLLDYLNKDISYVFVSPHSDLAVNSFLKRKRLHLTHFAFANEMLDFIASIFREIGVEGMRFPTHLIMKKNGEILAFYCGSINSVKDALPITNFINNLP